VTAAGGAAALLRVRHETRIAYHAPVVEARSEVRKTPIDGGLQRVIAARLSVDPPVRVRSFDDYFGNRVHYFNRLEPHDAMRVEAECVVETRDGMGSVPPPGDARPWQQQLAEFLAWSSFVPALPHYAEIRHGLAPELEAERFLDELTALAEGFARRFRYEPGSTHVHSTPEDLFERGGGVCQDLAHALIGVARLAGVPARYASGYLCDGAGASRGDTGLRGAAASHAWVEVWHPELGWVGIDPTNSQRVGWRYVHVAVGRDYGDVQPLRGVFVGQPGQDLSVEVEVERLR
jgi:transglutaminase-like putative cysteine protease